MGHLGQLIASLPKGIIRLKGITPPNAIKNPTFLVLEISESSSLCLLILLFLPPTSVPLLQARHPTLHDFRISDKEVLQLVGLYDRGELDFLALLTMQFGFTIRGTNDERERL